MIIKLVKDMGQREAGAEGKVTNITEDADSAHHDLYRVEFNDGKEPPIRWLFADEVAIVHDGNVPVARAAARIILPAPPITSKRGEVL